MIFKYEEALLLGVWHKQIDNKLHMSICRKDLKIKGSDVKNWLWEKNSKLNLKN